VSTGLFSHSAEMKTEAFRPQKTVRRSERLPSDFVSERFDWSAETMSIACQKQEVFGFLISVKLEDRGLRGSGGRPVSGRGGDIRTAP